MTFQSYKTRRWLWLAMSLVVFIALGRVSWILPKEGDLGVFMLGWLRHLFSAQDHLLGGGLVGVDWFGGVCLAGWIVVAAALGWCLHSILVIAFTGHAKSKGSA
jgi:hypothetical protein